MAESKILNKSTLRQLTALSLNVRSKYKVENDLESEFSDISMRQDSEDLTRKGLSCLFAPARSKSEYDKWIQDNLKVRECNKYVEKSGKGKKSVCECNSTRSEHMSGTENAPEGSTWSMETNTKLIENNAYGKINFENVETASNTHVQYVRMAKDYETADQIKKMETLLKQFWKLNEPDLLVSVTGGAKSFNVSRDICTSFQQGLLNVAKSTNAWIITGGQNCGVMKLVGDVMGRSVTNNRIVTLGIGNWGKTWNRCLLLNKNSRLKDQEMIANYKIENPEKGYAALDPNHTHHILIDNGATKIDGTEHAFRSELENLVCDMYSSEGVHLPMICIMMEGGLQSLETALGALRKGHTLVILKGSGRISDIVCYAYENSIQVEKMENGLLQEVQTFRPETKAEVIKMIAKDFGKYKITDKIIEDILEISTYRFYVTIYSIHNPEPLDFYILSSLMQSSAKETVLPATRIRQMKLAITWGHAVIAREFIFSRKLYRFTKDELHGLLLFSIIKQRTEFVKLLMDYGADMQEFATQKTVKKLFNTLHPNCGGYRLLQDIKGYDDREIELADVGLLMERILQGSHESIFSHRKYNENATGLETFENPFDIMTLYSTFMTCQNMALLFWEKAKTPMTTGLVVHKIYNYLDMMEGRWARIDEEMTEKLERSAAEFELLSCSLMTMCYHHYDKREWVNILTAKMKDWGYLSLFDIATITYSRNFISHATYQSHLTDIWMGGIHPSTPTYKLLLTLIPPLPVFLKYNTLTVDGRSPDDDDAVKIRRSWMNKLTCFYTSPVSKFMFNTITYLVFLGLYVRRLLAPNVCPAESWQHNKIGEEVKLSRILSWMDYYLVIFVVSTVPIEIAQIVNEPTKTLRKKLQVHFTELYNIIDLLAIIVFGLAFLFKASLICPNEERYQLSHFTHYHVYRLFGAACFVLYCLRFIQMFEIHDKIGPKIFILKRMTVDLFFFLFLLIVFTIAYCISTEALLYPFHERKFSRIVFDAFQRSYLNIFGDLDISGFMIKLTEGHCNNYTRTFQQYRNDIGVNFTTYPTIHELKKYWPNMSIDYCADNMNDVRESKVGSINFYISFGLLCFYLLTANIMLINLLIAVFSNTYADTEARSGIIYKTQRANVINEFQERPTLPNPLSLLYYITHVPYLMIKGVCSKTARGKKSKIADRQVEQAAAFRATLIEAECMVLHIRKINTKSDAGLILIEKVSQQNKEIAKTIQRLCKDLKCLAETNHNKEDNRLSTIFEKEDSTTDIVRFTVPDNLRSWDLKYEWYDPPEYTEECDETDESEDTDIINFNVIDDEGIDRRSWYKVYPVVDGDPLNPMGRTGLKGRGTFLRWGPNHYAVTVLTRWSKIDGEPYKTKNKNIIDVLILRLTSDPNFWKFPMITTEKDPNLTSLVDNKNAIKKYCLNYSERSEEERNEINEKVENAFETTTHVFKGYFEDNRNSDNAWLEVDVVNIHETDLATIPIEKSREVVEIVWLPLDRKITMKNNESWLLKKICNKLKCFNPYKGESLL